MWSEVPAWIGAISGATSLSWLVRNWWLDRPDLRITTGVDARGFYFALANAGRRVIHVQSLYLATSNGAATDGRLKGLPKVLNEGQHVTLPMMLDWTEQQPSVTGFFFLDTIGNRWWVAHGDFIKVRAACRTTLKDFRKRAAELRDSRMSRTTPVLRDRRKRLGDDPDP